MSKMSPTQRTIRELKNNGRVCAIVEKWNPHAGPHGIRQAVLQIVVGIGPTRAVVVARGVDVDVNELRFIGPHVDGASDARIAVQIGHNARRNGRVVAGVDAR